MLFDICLTQSENKEDPGNGSSNNDDTKESIIFRGWGCNNLYDLLQAIEENMS